MRTVTMDAARVALARDLAAKIAATATLKDRENYTRLDGNPERYFVGYLGELAMAQVLDAERVRFQYKPRTDGKSDDGDFRVFRRGNPSTLDVKTAGEAWHMRLMIPQTQFSVRRAAVYVGARLRPRERFAVETEVEIHGWAPLSDVLTWASDEFGEWKVATRSCLLTDLRPLEELFGELDLTPPYESS